MYEGGKRFLELYDKLEESRYKELKKYNSNRKLTMRMWSGI